MSKDELIEKLKRFKGDREVVLLDHRCLEAFPTDISVVRKIRKKELDMGFCGDDAIVID
jgi:hypothetical protein